MMMAKKFRWICPECGSGKNIGARPRRNASDRFCFPCSERVGVLVERACPVLDRKRGAGIERTKAKRERKVERESARFMFHGVDIRKITKRVWRVARTIEPMRKDAPRVDVRYSQSSFGGRAWPWEHRFLINRGKKYTLPIDATTRVIIHEIAHLIAYRRGYVKPHGDTFCGVLTELETACVERGIIKSESDIHADAVDSDLTEGA